MRYALLAGLLALAAAARAQVQSRVVRGDLILYIPVRGTVEADDIARVRSPIEGRIEIVKASADAWYHPDEPLGYMASAQLAALMDSNHTTPEETLQERWKNVFPLNPLRCADDCFLLSISARPKAWAHPGEVLFRAARTLRLRGRLSAPVPEGAHASDSFYMWPVSDPRQRVRVGIERLTTKDVSALLPFGANFVPGSAWEGRLEVPLARNVLKVPTSALFRYKGATYLPLKVVEGISLDHETEIRAGAREGEEILVIKPDEWAQTDAPKPLPPGPSKKTQKKPSAEPLPLPPEQDPGLYALPNKPEKQKQPVDDDDDVDLP